jgi:multiple sugar transport system substrate-binding protein
MAPLPQWDPAHPSTGTWGGSTTVVGQSSDHVDEAAEFARWLNTDPEAMELLVSESSVYPAAVAGRSTPALSQPPSFLPDQPDFYATAARIADTVPTVTRGPNTTIAYTAYEDAFGAAVQGGGSFTDALAAMQRATYDDMARVGFTVTDGGAAR